MRRELKALFAGLATAFVGTVLLLSPLGTQLEENLGLSWLFNWRGFIKPPEEVVVMAITDQTGESLGISKLPREWSRTVHANLVENLTRSGASAIVFDFDFQLPKKPEDDTLFAKATNSSGRVVFVEKLIGKRQPILDGSGKQAGSVWVEQLMPPIPELADAAKGLGVFPLPKVQVAVHQFWAFKSSIQAPTMPVVALQIHAMAAYPQLMELLQSAGVTAPSPPAANTRAAETLEFMRQLRTLFISNPDLGDTLKRMLADKNHQHLTNEERLRLTALIGLYTGEDSRYLNFYGPPGTIATIPYQLFGTAPSIAANTQLPDLTGKVVFVGFSDLYDPGQPDRFYTVFSNDEGVDLSGVEIAATAFANLLSNNSLQTPELLWELLLIAGLGLIMGTAAYLLPAIAGAPLVLLFAVGYAVTAHMAFSKSNIWLPVAIPLLIQLPLALFNGLLTQYFLERRKKNRANKAISMYLPENLAKEFTEKNLDEKELNRVTYCVCFASDMAGFTTISEILKPKELAAFLNDYFDTLSAPLRRNNVDVLEFRADGIMCAWTAEQPEIGIRRKALLAGLEAIEAIAEFKKRYAQFEHSLRIGLEVGMAYVGHAGGGGHYVYSIVGDCANTAARIEALNKHLKTQLLASQQTLAEIDGLLCRFLGEFRFVGKTEPLPIYEIVALKATASHSQTQLCEQFEIAMALMQKHCWDEASQAFKNILNTYPTDGPSAFHLARCAKFAVAPPDESAWIVHMDAK